MSDPHLEAFRASVHAEAPAGRCIICEAALEHRTGRRPVLCPSAECRKTYMALHYEFVTRARRKARREAG